MMRNKTWLFMLLTAILVAGCVRFHPQPLTPDRTAADFQHRTLDAAGLRSFIQTNTQAELSQWPLREWGFTNLVLAALYFQPELDVARAQWAVAQAGIITAGQRPNPSLSVSPGYDTTTSVPSPWIVTSTLDVPLETAGKRRHRVAQATHLSEAARLKLASVAWQVRSRVRMNLVQLQVAQETQKLLKDQQATQSELIRLLQLQLDAGAISAFEVTQARLEADKTRLALYDAERQYAEARVQLAAAMGVPVSALEGVTFSFDGLTTLPSEVSFAEARRQALLNRPDILSALAEYAASQSALQLEVARQFPDINLSPGYEYDQGDNKWSLGLSVTLPGAESKPGSDCRGQSQTGRSRRGVQRASSPGVGRH